MDWRYGDWMQTYEGNQFWPLHPMIEDVNFRDIAHALSLICRYGGHCIKFYSVAEHSVLLSRAVSPENRLYALLHDAAEAYVGDVVRPLKRFMPECSKAEQGVLFVILTKAGLIAEVPKQVNEFDLRMLGDERAQNMKACVHEWAPTGELLGVQLEYWSPEKAEKVFLDELVSCGVNIDD